MYAQHILAINRKDARVEYMTHVSPDKLPEKVEKELFEQLADVFLAHETKKRCRNLVYELFTPAERVMFAKRVAMVVLLERGYSLYAVGSALRVSESTVARIDAKRQRGAYVQLVETLQNKKHRESLLGTLEAFLRVGLPGEANKQLKEQMRNDLDTWRAGA